MIKRSYFMHAKINWLDGKQSYSWFSTKADCKSLFDRQSYVYEELFKSAVKAAEEKGFDASHVEVTCFSRC